MLKGLFASGHSLSEYYVAFQTFLAQLLCDCEQFQKYPLNNEPEICKRLRKLVLDSVLDNSNSVDIVICCQLTLFQVVYGLTLNNVIFRVKIIRFNYILDMLASQGISGCLLGQYNRKHSVGLLEAAAHQGKHYYIVFSWSKSSISQNWGFHGLEKSSLPPPTTKKYDIAIFLFY